MRLGQRVIATWQGTWYDAVVRAAIGDTFTVEHHRFGQWQVQSTDIALRFSDVQHLLPEVSDATATFQEFPFTDGPINALEEWCGEIPALSNAAERAMVDRTIRDGRFGQRARKRHFRATIATGLA